MPLKWTQPECILIYKNISIYRCYDGFEDKVWEHWYTTDMYERPRFEFDIRELDYPEKWYIDIRKKEDIEKIIQHAIDTNQVPQKKS